MPKEKVQDVCKNIQWLATKTPSTFLEVKLDSLMEWKLHCGNTTLR